MRSKHGSAVMAVKFYEGERIYLRPLELSDEPQLRQWINHPDNWRTLRRVFPCNEVREREWIEKLYASREDIALGIIVKEGDRLVGSAGLMKINPVNRSAVFGILIGDLEYQSRGYGTEATRLMVKLAFEEFNLNRVELSVLASNPRGIKAYERAGFVFEGRAREAYFRGGRYVDELRYAILRSEWEPNQGLQTETVESAHPLETAVPASLAV